MITFRVFLLPEYSSNFESHDKFSFPSIFTTCHEKIHAVSSIKLVLQHESVQRFWYLPSVVASKILGSTSIVCVVVTSNSLLGEEELGEGESVDTDVSVSVVDGGGAGKSGILKLKQESQCVYSVVHLDGEHRLLTSVEQLTQEHKHLRH